MSGLSGYIDIDADTTMRTMVSPDGKVSVRLGGNLSLYCDRAGGERLLATVREALALLSGAESPPPEVDATEVIS